MNIKYYLKYGYSRNTFFDATSMWVHRLRRWPNIGPTPSVCWDLTRDPWLVLDILMVHPVTPLVTYSNYPGSQISRFCIEYLHFWGHHITYVYAHASMSAYNIFLSTWSVHIKYTMIKERAVLKTKLYNAYKFSYDFPTPFLMYKI